MQKIIQTIKQERWDLHIYGGAILGILASIILILLNTTSNLRYFDWVIIQTSLGFIVGQGFEIFQASKSGKFIPKYKKLYDWNVLSKTHPVKPDYRDAIATAVGFMIISFITGLFI